MNKTNPLVILRSWIVFIICMSCCIFSGTIGLLLLPLRKYLSTLYSKILIYPFTKLNHYLLRKICHIKYDIHNYQQFEKLSQSGEKFIIVSNHQSAWETAYLVSLSPRITFIIKKSLLYTPFFGWGLAMLNPVAITRQKATAAMRQLMRVGKQNLQDKKILVFFPEGTRQTDPYKLQNYKIGSTILAKQNNAKILPVVHNAATIWRKNSMYIHPGKITVIFGEPIDCTDQDPYQINKQISEWTKEQLALMEQQNKPTNQ